MLDAMQRVAVLVKPRQRSDRARREKDPIRVPQPALRELPREHRRDGDAGEVVVGERRMAHIRRNEHLFLAFALEPNLAVGEVTRLERRVDDHVVLAGL